MKYLSNIVMIACLILPIGASAQINSPKALTNIANCIDLQNISTNLIGQYVLVSDIDCSGLDFIPIGTTEAPFVGSLDGAGHVIRHLAVNQSANSNVGLFGVTNHADIRQLILEDVVVAGTNQVGTLIGSATNITTVSKIQASGNVTTAQSGQNIGGLIGSMVGNSTVDDSSTSVVVRMQSTVATSMGGLVGSFSQGSIRHSFATGPVSGSYNVGGLIGSAAYGSVSDCSATGAVDAPTNGVNFDGNSIGGLIGFLAQTAVIRSYAAGSVKGSTSVGGLIGYTQSGSATDSYASGKVAGTSGVGGLVGDNGATIQNTYSTGLVTGTSNVGGLLGSGNTSLVTSSYWDTQTSGRTTSAGGTGKTTADMYQQNTYVDWDFANTWNIHAGNGYPWLRTTDQQIKTCAQLQEMSGNLSASFRLVMSVDCSGVAFSPVGNDQQPFTGSLNGNGYTISNLNISQTDKPYVGLIGMADGAYITNLILKNIQVTGQKIIGSLIGYASGNTQISGVSADGYVSASTGADVGGLVGLLNSGSVSRSAVAITVDAANADYVGGLIGQNNGTVLNSYSLGTVSGAGYVGGLIGDNEGTVSDTYAAGKVTGSSNVGGLIGSGIGSTATASYWDIDSSGQSTSTGGIGKTTAEMYKQLTYTGWDFNNVWDMYEGYTYPWLKYVAGKELVIKFKTRL